MLDSTRRALRTLYQATLGCLIVVPLLAAAAAALPDDFPGKGNIVAVLAACAVATAGVAKVMNDLEDRGLIPAWLKGTDQVPAPSDNGPTAVDPPQDASQDPEVIA